MTSAVFTLFTHTIAAPIHSSDVISPSRSQLDPGPTEASGPHDLGDAVEGAALVSNGLWLGCPLTSTARRQLSATGASRALYENGALRFSALGVFWPAPRRCQGTPGHTDYHGVSDAVTAVAGITLSLPTSSSPSRLRTARTFPPPFAPGTCVALSTVFFRYPWTDPSPSSRDMAAGRKRARSASGTYCLFLWI